MAKKKKNSKKARNQQKNQLQQESAEALVDRAEAALSGGKAREAVELLKIAAKKPNAPDTIPVLLFRSYLVRERQLQAKGMHVEAEAVNRLAINCVTDAGHLEKTDLVLFAASAPAQKAFDAYAAYLSDKSPSLQIERQLVNRLLQTENWDWLDRLPSDTPIRKDASSVPVAVSQMNEGRWEAALEQLRHIPRSSPFAPLRLLCIAMRAFYDEDDKGFAKASAMIPEDFLLYPMMSTLRGFLTPDGGDSDEAYRADRTNDRLQIFFDGPVDPRPAISQLLADIKRKNSQKATRQIDYLARNMYPADPRYCKKTILAIISNMVFWEKCSFRDFTTMVDALLNKDEARDMMMRLDMHGQRPLYSAAHYIDFLPRLFPDLRRRSIAKSIIILNAFKKSRPRETLAYEYHASPLQWKGGRMVHETPWHLLGIDTNQKDRPHPYLAMALEGIACDPDNREWYQQIADMPRRSRNDQKAVESALLKMAERFPDDPFPLIELAGLYADKKAYRQAQKAIEKASKLAPYDNRVIDRKAALLLMSVHINAWRGKYHLARSDLEKAEALASRSSGPFIKEKAVLLDLLEAPWNADRIIAETVSRHNSFDRLYLLVLLRMDIASSPANEKPNEDEKDRIVRSIQAQIDTDMQTIGPTMHSQQIMQLLSPVPSEYAQAIPVTSGGTLKDIFSDTHITNMLRQVDKNDIIAACDRLLATGKYDMITEELTFRLNESGYDENPVMAFYQLVIDDLPDKTGNAPIIIDLIDDASPETGHLLMETAKRLAPYASGRLFKALQLFDFDYLVPDLDPWLDDFEDDDDFEIHGHLSDAQDVLAILIGDTDAMTPAQLLAGAEKLVDYLYCRGTSNAEIREIRKMIPASFSSIENLENIDQLLAGMPEKDIKKLSREARVLFFG